MRHLLIFEGTNDRVKRELSTEDIENIRDLFETQMESLPNNHMPSTEYLIDYNPNDKFQYSFRYSNTHKQIEVVILKPKNIKFAKITHDKFNKLMSSLKNRLISWGFNATGHPYKSSDMKKYYFLTISKDMFLTNKQKSMIKTFESYSQDEYKKAFSKVKDYLESGKKSKDEIISFISKYISDDAYNIDKLRIIIDRIDRNYGYYRHREYLYGNGITNEPTGMRSYIRFSEEIKKKLDKVISKSISEYEEAIKMISINTTNINFLFEKLFEFLKWINSTCIEKNLILSRPTNHRKDIINKLDSLNKDMDFDDEGEEYIKIIKRCRIEIKNMLQNCGN